MIIVYPPFYKFFGTPNNWMFQSSTKTLDGCYAAELKGAKIYNADAEYDYEVPYLEQHELMEAYPKFKRRILDADDFFYRKAAGDLVELDDEFYINRHPENMISVCYLSKAILKQKPEAKIYTWGEAGAIRDLTGWFAPKVAASNVYLDTLPLLRKESFLTPIESKDFNAIEGSRGCDRACKFCVSAGTGVRKRKGVSIAREMLFRLMRYGVKSFYMLDNCWGADYDAVRAVGFWLDAWGLDVEYMCEMRADNVDMDMIGMLKKSGCRRVKLGVEVFDNESLKFLGKQETERQIELAIKLLKDNGIEVSIYILLLKVGPIDERAYDKTIRFLIWAQPAYVTVSSCALYPGTELYEQLKDKIPDGLKKLPVHWSRDWIKFWGLDESICNELFNLARGKERTI